LAARKFIKQEELDKIEKAAADLFYEYQRPLPAKDGTLRTPRGPR
jgi:hypothetical protein